MALQTQPDSKNVGNVEAEKDGMEARRDGHK